jgi:hypothetical protein
MSFFEKIKDKLIPEPSGVPMSASASGGIGSRRGALGFEDDVGNLCSFGSRYYCSIASQARCLIFDHSESPLYVTMFIS